MAEEQNHWRGIYSHPIYLSIRVFAFTQLAISLSIMKLLPVVWLNNSNNVNLTLFAVHNDIAVPHSNKLYTLSFRWYISGELLVSVAASAILSTSKCLAVLRVTTDLALKCDRHSSTNGASTGTNRQLSTWAGARTLLPWQPQIVANGGHHKLSTKSCHTKMKAIICNNYKNKLTAIKNKNRRLEVK